MRSKFTIAKVGSANRIGREVNPKLAGTRISPYKIRVKPKGSFGPMNLVMEVMTRLEYFDDKNRPAEVENASSVKEILECVSIREDRADD